MNRLRKSLRYYILFLNKSTYENFMSHNIRSRDSWPSSGAKFPERFILSSWLYQKKRKMDTYNHCMAYIKNAKV